MEIQDIQIMMFTLLKSGMNEYQIAEKLHVSQPTVSRWLSGKIKNLKAQNYIALNRLYESCRVSA